MTAWQWYETDKDLPKITNGDGTSDYVLAFPGAGCLPQVVKYSDGNYIKRGWWTTDFRHLSMKNGGLKYMMEGVDGVIQALVLDMLKDFGQVTGKQG